MKLADAQGIYKQTRDIPLSLWRDKIIHTELPVDFLQTEMDCIVIKMSLGDTVRRDSSGKTGNFSLRVTPPATTLARGIEISYTSS